MLMLVISIAACGQKGPLMLPGEAQAPPAQGPRTTQPAQQQEEQTEEDEEDEGEDE
jgi:predicted small lipoprotein YifL